MEWIVNVVWIAFFVVGVVVFVVIEFKHKAYMRRHNYTPPLLD